MPSEIMNDNLNDNIAELEQLKNDSSCEAYHTIASKIRLSDLEDNEDSKALFGYLISAVRSNKSNLVKRAKAELVRKLMKSGGDTTTKGFKKAMEDLNLWNGLDSYDSRVMPSNDDPTALEGAWITLSKPQFSNQLGVNEGNDPIYTLGRMSFGMFRPTNLQCSIQGTFNKIEVLSREEIDAIEHFPASIEAELKDPNVVVRSYDILTAFTIEHDGTRKLTKPLQAVMKTIGYVLPNPKKNHRLTIWFTGGSIELNGTDAADLKLWHRIFDRANLPKQNLSERLKLFGAKMLMGAKTSDRVEANGRMSYTLEKPIGGHDTAFVEILYLDETLRVVRANNGTTYVFARVPEQKHSAPSLPTISVQCAGRAA